MVHGCMCCGEVGVIVQTGPCSLEACGNPGLIHSQQKFKRSRCDVSTKMLVAIAWLYRNLRSGVLLMYSLELESGVSSSKHWREKNQDCCLKSWDYLIS